jgi:hypothetical protein
MLLFFFRKLFTWRSAWPTIVRTVWSRSLITSSWRNTSNPLTYEKTFKPSFRQTPLLHLFPFESANLSLPLPQKGDRSPTISDHNFGIPFSIWTTTYGQTCCSLFTSLIVITIVSSVQRKYFEKTTQWKCIKRKWRIGFKETWWH